MHRHILMDRVPVAVASVIFKRSKLFRDSIESPPYEELIDSVSLEWPEINGEGCYEVAAHTMFGKLDPAFRIARWKGDSFPTIIYHHGNNERPFKCEGLRNNTFHEIFGPKNGEIDANLIVVRAPYHCCYKYYRRQMARLTTFTNLLAVSVSMVEALRKYAADKGSRVIVSGVSLGGWVTNLHRTFYNTADRYIPLLAGAAPSDVFTSSAYRTLTAGRVHENPTALKQITDFEEQFTRVKSDNVFPLLARYDQIIRYEKQKPTYKDHPITVIDKGHYTGVRSTENLRNHILKSV